MRIDLNLKLGAAAALAGAIILATQPANDARLAGYALLVVAFFAVAGSRVWNQAAEPPEELQFLDKDGREYRQGGYIDDLMDRLDGKVSRP